MIDETSLRYQPLRVGLVSSKLYIMMQFMIDIWFPNNRLFVVKKVLREFRRRSVSSPVVALFAICSLEL
jgi:hypothetical protein